MFLIYLFLLLALASAATIPPNCSSDTPTWSDAFPEELLAVPNLDAEFDYIVVGGGTAGITIASRLAEHNHRVALVEAGGIYETLSWTAKIPGADSLGVGSDPKSTSLIDWHFVTYNVSGANGRDVHYPRGKCLGGSSALNFMIYQRPTKQSMQLWADLVQDQSYAFDSVFPFFTKTVAFTPPSVKLRSCNATARYNMDAFAEHGEPLHVAYSDYAMSFSSWMERGLEAIGIHETTDFNSGSLNGSQYTTSTIRPFDQTRSSSKTAFFYGASSSQRLRNLKVYIGTLAKRILFDSSKRATGVRVKTGLVTYTLRAKYEVILSAGAFQSPQLLMVSGVGPADTLQAHGIDVISNLPGVGQNLRDHVFFGPTYQVALETFTKLAADPLFMTEQLTKYITTRTGMLTNPVTDYLAFEKLPEALRSNFSAKTKEELDWFPDDWPELEYISAAAYVGDFSNPFTEQPKGGPQYATILASILATTSSGNVTIKSADTKDLPEINLNWLSTETDQQLAVAAYKRIRAAFHSEAMAPIVVGDEYFPGMEHATDEQILDVIRNTVMTIYHAACTCKMGLREDSMAVLDSKARVYGVEGLRVVDASSFPILVPGHPQSTVYMLAEKIASDIVSPKCEV
ncbi:hypothetical protein SI65_02208 [Aspergillus cristatus]|uniref:Glucose-methanol-choline oxidoreductase N-terminal domain-containing protein n=1 Tax=Aspergillus cristatus TaxID=573508 RepID=A0A1E3BK73_ASPCR|nr:hypothetical protein SI65_02208 [Aspergillus cristatus]